MFVFHNIDDTARHSLVFKWNVVMEKISKNVLLNILKILHYISKLNFVAHGVKFSVLELICT